MSVMRKAYAAVQEPALDQRHWAQIHGERGRRGAAKFASVNKFAATKFLLTHVTIMASVMCEPSPYDWFIKPECSHLVNNNQDAWENEVLRMSAPSFQGSFNFVEHFQNSKASKGYIVDAILRKIMLGPDTWVYYCDLLVATDLAHEDLVKKIRSGEVKYLSMGCLTDLITCSYCGASGDGQSPCCIHLTDLFKGRYKPDQWGIPRRIAELCFPPDTRVAMGDGSRRKISEVQAGDRVFTHTGALCSVTQTLVRDYEGPMVSLGISGIPQRLTSTPEHPYWVISPRSHCACGCGTPLSPFKRQASRYKDYTRSYVVGHNPCAQGDESLAVPSFAFKEAKDLCVGDLVALPVPTNVVVPADVDLIRAELLGWFLAEGSYFSHKGVKTGVTFTLNGADEIPIAENLRILLEQAFPPESPVGAVDPSRRKVPKVYHYSRTEGGTKLIVNYSNRTAVQWFLRHAGEYAETKRLSADAVLWPLELQQAILRAYVAGDGTVDGIARFSVVSVSETLISQMQLLAARCGIWTRRQVIFDGKAVDFNTALDPTTRRDSRRFRPLHTLHFQPSDATTEFFGTPAHRTHVRQLAPGWRQHDGYMLYRVTEVATEDYAGPVHNLEVAEDHSYLVEGIAVHNCGHKDLPGGGVRFVEASWVGTPAFPGAVTRSILYDGWEVPVDAKTGKAASLVLPEGYSKTASLITTHVPELSTSQSERPEPRVISELRRLR